MTFKHPLEPLPFTFVRREDSDGSPEPNGWFVVYSYAGKLYRVSQREWKRYTTESEKRP